MILPVNKNRLRIDRGLTFIELMLVIILLGVIFILSIPRAKATFKDLQIRNTTQKISSLIRFAQSKAIAESKRLYLSYEPARADGEARFFLEEELPSIPPEEEVRGELERRFSVTVPGDIGVKFFPSISEGEELLTFGPDGSIEGSSIILQNDNRRFRIIAGGIIGGVEIKEGPE